LSRSGGSSKAIIALIICIYFCGTCIASLDLLHLLLSMISKCLLRLEVDRGDSGAGRMRSRGVGLGRSLDSALVGWTSDKVSENRLVDLESALLVSLASTHTSEDVPWSGDG
jgi:hypothetical protein